MISLIRLAPPISKILLRSLGKANKVFSKGEQANITPKVDVEIKETVLNITPIKVK